MKNFSIFLVITLIASVITGAVLETFNISFTGTILDTLLSLGIAVPVIVLTSYASLGKNENPVANMFFGVFTPLLASVFAAALVVGVMFPTPDLQGYSPELRREAYHAIHESSYELGRWIIIGGTLTLVILRQILKKADKLIYID